MTRSRDPVVYGVVTAVVIFFVGWITGMGGSLIPNAIFSGAMGILAGVSFALLQKFAKRKD